MQTFFYLELIKADKVSDLSYQKPIIQKVKSNFPELFIYDFDNLSEDLVLKNAQMLIGESKFCFVFIKILDDSGQIQPFLAFLRKLLQNKSKIKVFLLGQHPVLEKLLKPFQDNFYQIDNENKVLNILKT